MEVWAIVRGLRPAGTPNSPAVVVVVALVCTVSVAFWRAVSIETEHTVASQVDYEGAALCSKFGFAVGTGSVSDHARRLLVRRSNGYDPRR
jgi:hypothetical protein